VAELEVLHCYGTIVCNSNGCISAKWHCPVVAFCGMFKKYQKWQSHGHHLEAAGILQEVLTMEQLCGAICSVIECSMALHHQPMLQLNFLLWLPDFLKEQSTSYPMPPLQQSCCFHQ